MENIPFNPMNGYILLQDIKNEKITSSGLYIPDEKYNRFARVVKVGENSRLKPGDVVVKPIGRTTPIKIDGVIYDAIQEGFLFAKLIDTDETD